jgi:hypothetical protein
MILALSAVEGGPVEEFSAVWVRVQNAVAVAAVAAAILMLGLTLVAPRHALVATDVAYADAS